MKYTAFLFLLFSLVLVSVQAQDLGNYQYSNPQAYLPNTSSSVPGGVANANAPQDENYVYFDVRALINVPATSYLAIFSLTQVGKSAREADQILGDRMALLKHELDSLEVDIDQFYMDMVSLVPVYEYDTVKKRFSKTTYNEIPMGFELRKNMHIAYKDHDALDKILTVAADKGIYDLVKVEYFTDNPAKIQNTLMEEAIKHVGSKIGHYKKLGVVLDTVQRVVTEDFQVVYPQSRYASYQAYCSSTLLTKKRDQVNSATKATTRFYNKLPYESFDIILNQSYVQPVVQYTANVKIRFKLTPPPGVKIVKEVEVVKEQQKDLIWFTPEGELRTLKLLP